MIRLYSTLTRKKEEFVPIKPKEVSLYVCGITPYDTTHLGHAFTYITFDVLVRLFKHTGYKVNYTQNVTDINDRDNDLLKRAREENVSWQKLSNLWTNKFLNDMKKLNWIKPNNYIKASENIGEMINLINQLINNKLTYKENGNIYLDITKVKDFGKLSCLNHEQMLKKAKEFEEGVEDLGKKNVLDIRLWRASLKNDPKHIPSLDSPFGAGRPGWHIECSAMAISTLGSQIDVHGGGEDLIYPHHESEIAQSESATGKTPFAKYWMHTAPVYYKNEKMSKSLGNLILLSDLFKKYSPNAIRWYLLSHHYRQGFEFNNDELAKTQKKVNEIKRLIKQKSVPAKFESYLSDDLNTPKALSFLEKNPIKNCLSLLGFLI